MLSLHNCKLPEELLGHLKTVERYSLPDQRHETSTLEEINRKLDKWKLEQKPKTKQNTCTETK